MRKPCWLAAALAGVLHGAGPTMAQDWPTRPVTLVVPFAAGGAPDLLGRILAPHLAQDLGQSVIVENAGGAGGMTGTARVANAAARRISVRAGTNGTHAANQTLSKASTLQCRDRFHARRTCRGPARAAGGRARTCPPIHLLQFMAYAKANQRKMQYGSAGPAPARTLRACA